jgi:hypothetical protein
MDEPTDAEEKRQSLCKRFARLLWRERRTCFWATTVAVLLSIAAMILARRKLIAWLIAALAGLSRGCQGMLDGLKDLH